MIGESATAASSAIAILTYFFGKLLCCFNHLV